MLRNIQFSSDLELHYESKCFTTTVEYSNRIVVSMFISYAALDCVIILQSVFSNEQNFCIE